MSAPLRVDAAHARSPQFIEAAGIADVALRDEVLKGLRGTPKTLSPKLFYDDAGSRLFERICALDEYYLTRAELEILAKHASDIAQLAGPRCALIEYGSGAGVKVRRLLDALHAPAMYLPVDISREQLLRVASERSAEYPGVDVRPVCADYTTRFPLPATPAGARRVAFFPGSTIGNFHPTEAAAFLQRVRHAIGADGALVLGVDRRKDAATLNAAYNDRAGVTAAFNLNLLVRLNRELHADFDVSRFRHRALFDDGPSRIEMHIESAEAQVVHIAHEPFPFARGETIWTESSYKYDEARLGNLVGAAGFAIRRLWTDAHDRFWVAFLTPE